MAQLINITSEALQATVRRLLPSQKGFGEDLQASNVITPVIDLTPTAEGSVLPTSLQQAINFGGAETFSVFNNNTVIISTTGFFRITAGVTLRSDSASDILCDLRINSGGVTKTIWSWFTTSAFSAGGAYGTNLDLIVFVDAGETVDWNTSNKAIARGSVRQVADKQGNLVNPVGFTFE